MKNKLYCLFCFIFISLCAKAQREADCILNGDCFQNEWGCDSPVALIILKFNEDSLEEIIEPVNINLSMSFAGATFADKNGNLLFACNGWRLVNNDGEILANKLWREDIPWPGDNYDTNRVLNTLGPLFLNDPGDSTKAYLLYGQYVIGDFSEAQILKADVLFTFAYLDIPTKTLISKNNIILTDTTAPGDMQACRHANGRDWWVIKPGIFEDEYFIGLLDPNGLQMEKRTTPTLPHRGQLETFSFFSHSGDKFIHQTGRLNKIVQEFDFDRCTGILSNLRVHDLSDSIQLGYVNSCNISADGSKFYIGKGSTPPLVVAGLLQYDLSTSTYTFINGNGGICPILAPNGKSILTVGYEYINGQDQYYYNEIMQPNALGAACNFVANKYTLQNIPANPMPPNFANFRLGPIDGSTCDTLGIDAVNIKETLKEPDIKVFPNPFTDELNITFKDQSFLQSHLSLYNSAGQLLLQRQLNKNIEVFTTELNALKPGMYFLLINDKNGSLLKKLKVVKE